MLTTDPIYWKSFQPKIEIKNLINTTTYYTFDAFNDVTTNKVVYCRVDLGIDHHGTFEIQIENSNQALDTTNIKKGQRVIISVKKDASLSYSGHIDRLISGLIRKTGYTRGIGGQALFTIQGSSTAIRFNERVTYFVREAAKLAQDGITIDVNDATMKADALLQTLLNISGEAYTASGIVASSDVENFIPSVATEFGELQDAINTIEEQSNGEVFVDVDDVVQFRHQLQPSGNSGRGFILKDSVGTADNADTTCYYDGTPEYFESIYKSDGFASRVYGILPTDKVPSTREDIGFLAGSPQLNMTATQEHAQKFRPQHSRFFPGDILIVGIEEASNTTTKAWIPRFRICNDSGGLPQNIGGIVANIDFLPDQFDSPLLNSGSPTIIKLLQDQIFYNSANTRIDSFSLDTAKDYWLIASNDNIPASAGNVFFWGNKLGGTGLYFNNTGGLSTNANGGTGYLSTGSFTAAFSMPRRRSIAFECSDHKSVAATGSGHTGTGGAVIETTLTNIPAVVKTREAMYKYMTNQLYYMARPQPTWPTFRVSAPNIPILPNDPLLIVDSTLLFSTSGSQAVTATTGAMSYEFGQRGGTGNSISSSLYLNITPVGFANHY